MPEYDVMILAELYVGVASALKMFIPRWERKGKKRILQAPKHKGMLKVIPVRKLK